MSIQVSGISKRFGDFVALDDVSLEFPSGELVALLGPSGCGKTTLLRVIAGLETADSGRVILDGEDASDTHVRERQVGFARPHQLEIVTDPDAAEGVQAVVSRVLGFGARARIELDGVRGDAEIGPPIHYEVILPRERVQALHLREGQAVRLVPIGLRIFKREVA